MDELYKISERIKELMEENNLSSYKLEKKIGVDSARIRGWTQKNRSLRISALILLADYFKCSLEYLVGRIDNEDGEFISKPCPPFMPRFEALLKERKIKIYHLTENSRITDKHIYIWRRGSEPSLSSLLAIADYLKCTLDFLVGRE